MFHFTVSLGKLLPIYVSELLQYYCFCISSQGSEDRSKQKLVSGIIFYLSRGWGGGGTLIYKLYGYVPL